MMVRRQRHRVTKATFRRRGHDTKLLRRFDTVCRGAARPRDSRTYATSQMIESDLVP
jgi:hypothetical protein